MVIFYASIGSDTFMFQENRLSVTMERRKPHVIIFVDDFVWSEGAGAKLRWVKWGLWLTLRLNQLIQQQQHPNIVVKWLPNPAQMQNDHLVSSSSMMKGLGIWQSNNNDNQIMPPLFSPNNNTISAKEWMESKIKMEEFKRLDINLTDQNNYTEQYLLKHIHDYYFVDRSMKDQEKKPLAIIIKGPNTPMHYHGSVARWFHNAFYTHRPQYQSTKLIPRPAHTKKGRYLISIHRRQFEMDDWNLPISYYRSALKEILLSPSDIIPMNCTNTDILIFGYVTQSFDFLEHMKNELPKECSISIHQTNGKENDQEPSFDPYAKEDLYTHTSEYNELFSNLEIMGLSDVMIGSNSEFSAMVQCIKSPMGSITLCPPRRPGNDNIGLPCTSNGSPYSILTNPEYWGNSNAIPTNQIDSINTTHVHEQLERLWRQRISNNIDTPIWDSSNQGIIPFDWEQTIETNWPNATALWYSNYNMT